MSEPNTIYAPSRPVEEARRQVEPPRLRETHAEPRWPAWKVSTFVIVFCAAFWTGVVWLGSSLFS